MERWGGGGMGGGGGGGEVEVSFMVVLFSPQTERRVSSSCALYCQHMHWI